MNSGLFTAAFAGLVSFAFAAQAQDYVLTLKDHQFEPATLELPAGEAVKVTVRNQDATPAEFESEDLGREKVIAGNAQAIVQLGPLKAGEYTFFDDYNRGKAKGKIVVK